ncbi:MAG: glycosyl hydrolase family 28 protein, partial [Thermoguttaceae bacterium]
MRVQAWLVIAAVFAIPISAAGQTPAAKPTGPRSFDVRDFGAVGDGKSLDTVAIQRAIDACSQQGGGVVVVNHGNYLTGTIHLRSHVELHLASTTTLLGVGDLAKYHRDTKEAYKLLDRSLIFAEGCDQIAITGQGTIDGQGKQFKNGDRDSRPVLIRLRDCTHLCIEGVLVKNAASFAVHPIHCRQVRIEGLRIENRAQPNNDGIDIDGCQEVFISNCNISSIDDSIALKTIEPGQPCRDVVITNCILSSDCAAIRVGPDAVTPIERVCVSNCVIRDTHLNGIKIQESFGSVIRDMVFSNIVMDNVTGPISIRLAGWKLGTGNVWAVFDDSNWEKGQLRNILFQNIRARVPADNIKSCISITGARAARPREITFSNLDISFPGGGTSAEAARRAVPDLERDYPECFIFGVLPAYAFYVHHADRITLDNVRFHLEARDLRPAIVCDDVEDFDVAGLKADGSPRAESLLRMQNARGVYVHGSRVLSSIGTFLQVEGDKTQRIVVKGNDLSS